MKKILTLLALICVFIAILISVLPISNLAIFPAVTALILGIIVFYLSKKMGEIKKIIPFIFFLATISLVISAYKAFFTETKVADTEVLNETETKLEEEAIEELDDLELDDLEIDEEIEIEDDLETISLEE